MKKLDAKIPAGPLAEKWVKYRSTMPLVAPHNKLRLEVIVVAYSLSSTVNPLLKVAKMNHCKTDDGLSDFDKNALETCKKMTIDEAYQKEVAARATGGKPSDDELHEKRMTDFLNNMAATLNRMSQDENYRQQVAARATTTQN